VLMQRYPIPASSWRSRGRFRRPDFRAYPPDGAGESLRFSPALAPAGPSRYSPAQLLRLPAPRPGEQARLFLQGPITPWLSQL